ncbi:MAG: lamin tail domain-containing protein [Bacteroidetes bacterium]|nr:lamin tail domain-containing protein [Bacteroidota bacterium]
MNKFYLPIFFFFPFIVNSQVVKNFPYSENFDTVSVPFLPLDWGTSKLKSSLGDFLTTSSIPNSSPNAILSTDSKIMQWIKLPLISFVDKVPEKLEFFERRSSTHNSGIVFEYSFANDTNFIQIGDTLKFLSANYIKRSIPLPLILQNKDSVNFRLKIVGNGTGSTGTIRFDDFLITVKINIDLGIHSITLSPIKLIIGDSALASVFIKNYAVSRLYDLRLKLFDDSNLDSLFTENEVIKVFNFSRLIGENELMPFEFYISNPKQGFHSMQLQLIINGDEDLSNNILKFNFVVGSLSNSIIINEVMYEPFSNSSEYIELQNISVAEISLLNWKINDMATPSGIKNIYTFTKNIIIQPNSFILISADSTIFNVFPNLRLNNALLIINKELSLGNIEDDVVLRDNTGNLIDSIRYSNSWHRASSTQGRSLEKIISTISGTNSNNWSTSVNKLGGTPAEKNSIITPIINNKVDISISPNPFSPDGDGFEDFTIISYNLNSAITNIRARIFDRRGYLVRSLANNDASTSTGNLIWDGFNDDKQRLRIGAYILLFEALDQKGTTILQSKNVIIVAKSL